MHAQSYPTLWDSVDCSPQGSSVHGLSQARILEGVVISFSRRSSQPRDQTPLLQHCRRALYRWATREEDTQFSTCNYYKLVVSSCLGYSLKNTGNGAVEICTARSQITVYKCILCSHRRRKSVPLLTRTIGIFTVELIKSFGWQSPFSILLKIITIILKTSKSSISSRQSRQASHSSSDSCLEA